MKITRREFGHDYATFRFGYYDYALLEEGDALGDFYERGFLPYSLDPKVRGSFYMCRSARVPLKDFAFTSENRRIAKRFDDTLTTQAYRADETPGEIAELFLDYFAKRHGKEVMSPERFAGILASPLNPRVIVYKRDGEPLAGVIEVPGEAFGHFWYSAYDLSLVEQSLGMWLMLDSARRAKVAGLSHYYLGTVYGPKALYKANLEPMEFWDGSSWSPDIKRLKELARAETK